MKNGIKTQQDKAQLYFALMVFVNLSILSVMITGIVIGMKGYICDTRSAYEAVSCCGSICAKCLFTLRTFFTILPWVCVATLFIGVCKAVRRIFLMVYWNSHFISTHTAKSIDDHPGFRNLLRDGQINRLPVFIVDNPFYCAFTAGIWNPQIYLSTGVCSCLTARELLAVVLHEFHHKKNRIPLRLFVLNMLCELNFYFLINQGLLDLFTCASEMAADDNAVNVSGEPLELASALVKLSQSVTPDKLFSSASISGKQIETENRIRRLLEPHERLSAHGITCFNSLCFLTLFISTALCLPLFYKYPDLPDAPACKTHSCHTTVCK